MASMANTKVSVLLTNTAVLKNETHTRENSKQQKDEVTATLLSNGSVSFNYVKDNDGKRPFAVSLSNCDKISISKSRSNDALCIEIGCIVNHLIFHNRSLMENWYDTIVGVLNKLGHDFSMQTHPKYPHRRVASQLIIRPKTSDRKKKGFSAPPNPDMYTDYEQASDGHYEAISPNKTANVSTGVKIEEHNDDDCKNVNNTKPSISLHKTNAVGPNDKENPVYSNNVKTKANDYHTYIHKEVDVKHFKKLPPLPERPKVDHRAEQIGSGDTNYGVDRGEPVASAEIEQITSNDNTENINGQYLDPYVHNKNIEQFPKQPKEESEDNNTFRKRSRNVTSKKPDINKNGNKPVKRDDKRQHTKYDLMREMKQPMTIQINKKKLEGNIILSMIPKPNCVLFIACLKDSSLNHTLYEGDMITTINNQRIDSIKDAMETIRKTVDTVHLGIVRLPYGELVLINREENHSDLGFELDKRKVIRVDENGLAAMAGLRTTTTKATQFGCFTRTCVTAINGLPLSPDCTKEQTMELLSKHRDFVSLVVQPLDLITCLQQEIDSPETMEIYN